MKINAKIKQPARYTHEGAKAAKITPMAQLRRSVMSCLLWEREFYEDGQEIADRIFDLACKVKPQELSSLAIEVRTKGKLRHVPLLLLTALARIGSGSSLVSETFPQVIRRADELAEFLAVYKQINKQGKLKLSAQVKKGLAAAFTRFDAYQLAKYNRDGAIKLRDVLFLCHAKPLNAEQAALWAKLVEGTLESPDTWEVALSSGADKKETFTRLLREENLGYLALLRNMRNMTQSGVDRDLIIKALEARKGADMVLPFRYVAAARSCPEMAAPIDKALLATVQNLEPLPGLTVVLVDVSGSMDDNMSAKSDLRRIDAAATLAAIVPGDVRVFSFSYEAKEVPAWKGLAGIEAIVKSQLHGGTDLKLAIAQVYQTVKNMARLIVITDEQSRSRIPGPIGTGYMINVASAKNGVGYGEWVHIDGFSENVLSFIREYEEL